MYINICIAIYYCLKVWLYFVDIKYIYFVERDMKFFFFRDDMKYILFCILFTINIIGRFSIKKKYI